MYCCCTFFSILIAFTFIVKSRVECASETDDEGNCDELTKDSPWDDQKQIHPCHYSTHLHPRQQPRKNRSEAEVTDFHHLAIFNIRYGVDFQKVGDPCSVRLQQEWLVGGVGADGTNNTNSSKPVILSEYSYNRVWYRRMCNFFNFLDCIPAEQVRVVDDEDSEKKRKQTRVKDRKKKLRPVQKKKVKTKKGKKKKKPKKTRKIKNGTKNKNTTRNKNSTDTKKTKKNRKNKKTKAQSNETSNDSNEMAPHVFKTKLLFNDSGLNTLGMYRMKIGGRGPSKGRHKIGPGRSRVDPSTILGTPNYMADDRYPLDGICVCSYDDPEFPDRKRPDYGMDFVEDEARRNWCVAAPGNLCGRVYFKSDLWPGQSYELSDHIGCPKLYDNQEYECIRWQSEYAQRGNKHSTGVPTSTCEGKQKDPEFGEEAAKRSKQYENKKMRSDSDSAKLQTFHQKLSISTIVTLRVLYINFISKS